MRKNGHWIRTLQKEGLRTFLKQRHEHDENKWQPKIITDPLGRWVDQ